MNEYDVHWVTSGVTRVRANSPENAGKALSDYPFSDDANCTDIVEVLPMVSG